MRKFKLIKIGSNIHVSSGDELFPMDDYKELVEPPTLDDILDDKEIDNLEKSIQDLTSPVY